MKSPLTGNEMVLCNEKRTLTFRKQEFEVLYHFFKCEVTGETFTTTELDDLNLNQLYNQYRVKFNLPFPEEIQLIRKKYDLSVGKMSAILGFGDNVYRNYENGDVPSESNARLLQLASDPIEFKKLLHLSKALEGKALEKVLEKIDSLLFDSSYSYVENLLNSTPNVNTGYRMPNLEKLTEMVVYFTEVLEPFKTKLNKLLFYADFEMFRRTGFSISGAQYVAIDLGPVPNYFQTIYENLNNEGVVNIANIEFSVNMIGEKFQPNSKHPFNPDVFSPDELLVLTEVAEKFKSMSATEIKDYSHKEKAWIENERQKNVISYNYSFDLNDALMLQE